MPSPQSPVIYADQSRDLSLWYQHKELFRQLYVVENKRLEDVKKIMETEHSFPVATLNVYEIIFRKKLRLRKNLKRADWILIGDHLEKIKQEGKGSELYLNGIRVNPARVKKEVGRHRTKSDLAIRRSRLSNPPPLPDGIYIKTPPASPVPVGNTLPWSGGSHIGSMQSPVFQPYLLLQDHNAPWESTFGDFDISSHLKLRRNSPFNQLVLLLQDLTLSESSISGRTHKDSSNAWDYVAASSHDYSLANPNLSSGYSFIPPFSSISAYSLWRLEASPRFLFNGNGNPFGFLLKACFMVSNWHEFDDIKMLLDWIGISADIRILKAFFSLQSITILAFWDNLMREVHNLKHASAFSILVEVGLEVHRKQGTEEHLYKCLYTAAWIGSAKAYNTARRLLDCGVSPTTHETPLRYNLPVKDAGVQHYCPYPTPLHVAAHQLDIEMIQALITFGALLDCETGTWNHWNYSPSCPHLVMFGSSPLDYALMSSGPMQLQCVKLLLESGSKVDIVHSSKNCHWHELCGYTKSHLGWYSPSRPLLMTDRLWLSQKQGDIDLYNILAPHSERVQKWVTVSGIIAAARINVEILSHYLEHRSNPQAADKKLLLEIALSEAAARNDITASLCLLEYGVDPNVRELAALPHATHTFGDKFNWKGDKEWQRQHWDWNPLFRAGNNSDVTMMKLLSGHEANINEFNLIAAIMKGWSKRKLCGNEEDVENKDTTCLEVVKLILDNGFDIQRYGQEAMILASQAPHLHPHSLVCDLLHSRGMSFNIQKDNKDLLQISIQSSVDKIKFLIDRGLKVHSVPGTTNGNTMLHDALQCGILYPYRSQIVEFLLEHGADCTVDGGGLTILESSLSVFEVVNSSSDECSNYDNKRRDVLDVFQKLFSLRAPINGPLKRSKECKWESVLTRLIDLGATDALIHEVLDAGAHIDQQGTFTPLQIAVKRGRVEIAYELIRRGADVNTPAYPVHGSTVLQAACSPKNPMLPLHFIEFLIELGADVNAPPATQGGLTALQEAVFGGSLNAVCQLLDHGAEVNALSPVRRWLVGWKEYTGLRALDIAAMCGKLDMIQLLIDTGAESGQPGATRFDGAVKQAKYQGHLAVVHLLEEWGSGSVVSEV